MNQRAGVVGAGLMGAEIALVYALSGRSVILADTTDEKLEAARQRLSALMEKGISRGLYKPEDKAALARIETTTDLQRFSDCSVVTEAVFESMEVKSAVLKQLDSVCAPQCMIASNTSTLPISTLASHLSAPRRSRFLGMHYFSPVTRMKLVEVIPAFDTSEETLASALELARDLGKAPIRVKDVTGFAVNRVLHAFVIEAIRLVEEGVATPEDIDTACKLGLGHPIGPFELMDATTSSLCLQVQEILQEAYGERFRPRPLLKQRVRAGLVGGRTAQGWRPKSQK
ncbi:3-hydroxybutyryl-CoA dehydrogenase [Povalibacter uvarum]|uniref:3-hydroxybutyryl-CoA dehydrogenase n=1 Tax=Povalibacter uvarum TaxID=732238 RepID=A0A841HM88_9GAMM|nr:3-hydroxyacyl-CoA dehydrogenase family protein [Povalibacter uvarum]MBB6093469.1 3-hydroxybutyryl-CoA dehydrogenase [Povalibacter uvarum]